MIKLNNSGITFDKENHTYMELGKYYKGITRMIGNQLFPNQYSDIPKYILDRAAERGNRIHGELTTYDVLGVVQSEESQWYADLLKKHNITIVANEYIVSDKENFASPIDKVGIKDGEVILIDVKATYKLNIPYVTWQTSIYKVFFEFLNPHLKVGGVYVLHVKDGARLTKLKEYPAEAVQGLIKAELAGEQFENPYSLMDKEETKAELVQRAVEIKRNKNMEKGLITVDPEEFGLAEKTADELTVGLGQILDERELLIEEFEVVSKLEISEESIPEFKKLRLKIQKNRTQGINAWHKAGKEYFLRGGQFLDAIKKKELIVNENMERVLMDGEKHFENLEIERLAKLQAERVEKMSYCVIGADERDWTTFEEQEFEDLFQIKKKQYEENLEAEKKAEEKRIAEEKAEAKRQAEIMVENTRLKLEAEKREKELAKEKEIREAKEAEEIKKAEEAKKEAEAKEAEIKAKHEAELKAERDRLEKIQKEEAEKRKKLEDELKAKEEAEAKAKEFKEAEIQAELKKGDKAKLRDLLSDLEELKTKYEFKSKANKGLYEEVSAQLDEIINYINQ